MKNLGHEGYFNMGIQTFMKSDYSDFSKIQNYDITFVGVPCEYGASYRKGTILGPKYIREYSYWDDIAGGEFYDLDNDIKLKSNKLKICDIGDIHINPTNVDKTGKDIEKIIKKICKKSFPLIIGGDHSIAYHTIKGFISSLKGVDINEIAILHFDAHTDVEKKYIDMPRIYHGSPFRYLIEDNIIMSKNLYTVGPRGVIPNGLISYIEEKQINLFSMNYINKVGIHSFFMNLVSKLSEYKYVYISFDIDCIDPNEVKGTGTPLEGGFKSTDILFFIRQLKQLNIAGFELVELAPNLDTSGYSNMIACNILWHFLAFGFKNNNKNRF